MVIASYSILSRASCQIVQEALKNQTFKCVVLDESHYIKNAASKTSKYVVPLVHQAKRRLLVTGTPALSRPIEVTATVMYFKLLYVLSKKYFYPPVLFLHKLHKSKITRNLQLYSQLDALHKGLFGIYSQFARKYCRGRWKQIGKNWIFVCQWVIGSTVN